MHPLQAKTEAKLLLAAMLTTRAWRCSLDLACEKASSLAAVLLEEEAVALTRTTASGATRNAVRPRGLSLYAAGGPPTVDPGQAYYFN